MVQEFQRIYTVQRNTWDMRILDEIIVIEGIKLQIAEKEKLIQVLIQQLFNEHPDFKTWVESTSLFHAIVHDAKYGASIKYTDQDGEKELKLTGHQINEAKDLPLELIFDFYKNSPWYTSNQKLLL
jgi:hypothetical protein